MWLINDDGFFSTVQDYKDSDWVYVRGRSETDIEAFVIVARRATSQDAWDAEIVHTPNRDYSWRVHTPREVWADYLVAKTQDLGYGNFKSHCADRWMEEDRDFVHERLELLHDAWMLFNHWPDHRLQALMKQVSPDEALRGIYIDFEGGGSVRRALLGVFWLDDTNEFVFRQYLLDEALWPMGEERNSGNEGFWEPADLTDTLEELRQLAEAEDRLVFAYSEHEMKMIKEHLQEGELLDWWLQDQNLVNARKIAKYWKYWNRSVTFPPKEGQKKEWHSLQNYLDLIGYEVPSEHGPGVVSSAITQVRKELVEGDGPLSEEANFAWEQAVMHNFHDCCGMRELIIICATEHSSDSKAGEPT